jgi:hypothetical protein
MLKELNSIAAGLLGLGGYPVGTGGGRCPARVDAAIRPTAPVPSLADPRARGPSAASIVPARERAA